MDKKPSPVVSEWVKSVLPANMRLDGLCGSGGMGSVFRVYHADWGIHLALKVPHDASGKTSSFVDEAWAWSEMGLHPYVATLFYVRVLDGRPCTFSEFVEAGSVDAVLHRGDHRGADEQTTLSRILSLVASMAWGLGAAHAKDLVHCDFKPANALIGSEFTAKVTDFGLARRADQEGFDTPGATELYQSPEQARRELLTSATDFWSWAATCFEMFIGSPTWTSGSAVGLAFKQFVDEGAKFPGYPRVPKELIKILEACFAIKPEQRPTSFEELATAINRLHETIFGEPSAAEPPDGGLLAADSLNNRGVSHWDLDNKGEAKALFCDALALDPLHPQALFNQFVCADALNKKSLAQVERSLQASAEADSCNALPLVLLAKLFMAFGQETRAKEFIYEASARTQNSEGITNQLDGANLLKPMLAEPMSGEDFAYHKRRFRRLVVKAREALVSKDWAQASRYVLMVGDIPGFRRHPELRSLHLELVNLRNELLGN